MPEMEFYPQEQPETLAAGISTVVGSQYTSTADQPSFIVSPSGAPGNPDQVYVGVYGVEEVEEGENTQSPIMITN